MARYAYERLSALDNSFLIMENPDGYMHVASVQVFDAGPLKTPEGGVDFERIWAATEAVLHKIPRYRQKLAWIPIEGHAVWVDDPSFNLAYHMRHTSLPRPGTIRQLKRMAARIISQHLDRTKPLWESWVVEGLEGDRFAIINKTHHCMIDGISGVDLMEVLMSPTPDAEIPEPESYFPRPLPSKLELLGGELWRRSQLPLRALARARESSREFGSSARALLETMRSTGGAPSETPFNEPIGSHRRFDWFETDLGEIREVRKALGGSVNDVVLATVAGAVNTFLRRRAVDPEDVTFRVMTPVSTRTDDERGALGNRVSSWLIDLPIQEPDPRRRLEKITERTLELKQSGSALGAEALYELAEWVPSSLLAPAARPAANLLAFNMVVTNVPGPQHPLYVVGAKLLASYPCVPLTGRLGLGIALFSYDGKICWGLNADWESLPDLHAFIEALEASFAEIQAAARTAPGPRQIHSAAGG